MTPKAGEIQESGVEEEKEQGRKETEEKNLFRNGKKGVWRCLSLHKDVLFIYTKERQK